jgi:hypothetical protein
MDGYVWGGWDVERCVPHLSCLVVAAFQGLLSRSAVSGAHRDVWLVRTGQARVCEGVRTGFVFVACLA